MSEQGAKVVLHWLNGSRAQSTLFLLEHLGVEYELDIHHRQKDMLAPPALAKIHPLGKSPLVTVTPAGGSPMVLAESAFIVQYLSEHFGKHTSLVPLRWKEGQDGRVGGETDEWMRYQYLMYYAEGSWMASVVQYFIFTTLRGPNIPFLVRLFTRPVANQLIARVSFPNMKKHFELLESLLAPPPGGGNYLCGANLTGADVMMSYGLIASKNAGADGVDGLGRWEKGSFEDTFPKLNAYIERLEKEPAWQRSVKKIQEIEGSFSLLPS